MTGDTIIVLDDTKRPKKNENYFAEREELAVRMFLTADTFNEKNKIYNQFLRSPLDKMISSIIRRYKLYSKDIVFLDLHTDSHSFLMTKIDKFSPSKEKKAYSYFGTICKNYLMGQILKDQKETNRKISYEDISSDLENNPKMSYDMPFEEGGEKSIINDLIVEIKIVLDEPSLSDNEYKLGLALHEIFSNYESIFLSSSNNKFNKNLILLSLREMTNLSTKEIRQSIKKYKKLYIGLSNVVDE